MNETSPIGKPMLDTAEVAYKLNISMRQVDYLRAQGKITAYKIGMSVRYKAEEIEAFLETQKEVKTEVPDAQAA